LLLVASLLAGCTPTEDFDIQGNPIADHHEVRLSGNPVYVIGRNLKLPVGAP